eukprot:TRINITY_DN418_c0_g1_i4.p1 TRINITY_DN418_c0_g1~~TRINITY_DN418_c0_g1_i4.p1  ORF type:complete len:392 (-),score=103.73 TRINITY_DN418_c0_g1_i4:264-1439(-)
MSFNKSKKKDHFSDCKAELSEKHRLAIESLNEKKKLKVVCISDTHSFHSKMRHAIPDGDVLIHAGDFTSNGQIEEIKELCNMFKELPHKIKIVVAGNHDVTLDKKHYEANWLNYHEKKYDVEECISTLKEHSIYLQDEFVTIGGVKFYGTPWQPEFYDWAFNKPRGRCLAKRWRKIPSDVDVLITHTPPYGYGDAISGGKRVGCEDLMQKLFEVNPKFHVFGHIHENYGVFKSQTNGISTTFINCAICNHRYSPNNKPVTFCIDSDGVVDESSTSESCSDEEQLEILRKLKKCKLKASPSMNQLSEMGSTMRQHGRGRFNNPSPHHRHNNNNNNHDSCRTAVLPSPMASLPPPQTTTSGTMANTPNTYLNSSMYQANQPRRRLDERICIVR